MTDWRILINFHIKCLVLVESESKASTGYITAAETEEFTGRVTAFTASSLLAIELVTGKSFSNCLVTLLFYHHAKIVLVFLSLPS